jgi:HupE / UreJ protein
MSPWSFAVLGVVLGLIAGTVSPAPAHTLSESHSIWEVNGTDVDLVMTIPILEVQRVGGGEAMPSDAEVEAYLTQRIYPSASGQRCALIPPVEAPPAAPGFRKFDFTFRCPSPDGLQITSRAFFDLVPSHTNFAQIQNEATGAFTEQLFTNEHQSVDVSGDGASELKTASFFEFIGMGMMHIFTGIDHMSFLIGLVLISRRLRDLIFVVSGFTIGHSLTLALAVMGVIRPHAEYIDALVALTIVLIGAENIAQQTRKPVAIAAVLGGALGLMALSAWAGLGGLPALLLLGGALFTSNYLMMSGLLPDAGGFRMMITLIFGLIHGFGFASNLLEMQLPIERLAELLVGFNVGVELGQLTLVFGVTSFVAGLRRLRLDVPRPITVDLASCFLVGLGVYWFVTRSYA